MQKIEWINAKLKKKKQKQNTNQNQKCKTNKIIPKRKQICPHDRTTKTKKQKKNKNQLKTKMLSYIKNSECNNPNYIHI